MHLIQVLPSHKVVSARGSVLKADSGPVFTKGLRLSQVFTKGDLAKSKIIK